MFAADPGLYYRYVLYTAVLGVLPVHSQSTEDACYGGPVVLEVTSRDHSGETQQFSGFPSSFGIAISRHKSSKHYVLFSADPLDACLPLYQTFPADYAVLVERGKCEFMVKARTLEASNVSLMILYDNAEGCVLMGHNGTDDSGLRLAAVSVSQETGEKLKQLAAGGAVVSAWSRRPPVFDLSSMTLWAVAIATVAAGAVMAGNNFLSALKQPGEPQHQEDGEWGEGKAGEEGDGGVVVLSSAGAVAFVVISSAFLLLLYFFLNRVFYWVLVLFYCIASTQAIATLSAAWLQPHLPTRLAEASVKVFLLGDCNPVGLVLCGAAAGISIGWVVMRDSGWAWLLQDLMGVAVMLMVLRTFRLPDLKVSSLLLLLCFAYDVFWVFIQPRITQGASVMVEVAKGGGSNEMLPMLLIIPHREQGGGFNYAVLGFGDVVLPGLLVGFTRIFDLQHKLCGLGGYFLPCVAGYGVGLLATYTALYFDVGGEEGQPALLYLVPCTLGTVAALAAWRGCLRQMWDMDSGEKEEQQHALRAKEAVTEAGLVAVDADVEDDGRAERTSLLTLSRGVEV